MSATRDNYVEFIQAHVRCGACGGKIGRVNLCALNRRATWKYPVSGNVISGDEGRAVAVLCDACIDSRRGIREAIEITDQQVHYHPVGELDELPPEPTYVLREASHGPGIECLVCGLTSWNPNDVANRYCGHYKRFHEDPPCPAEP